MEKKIKSLVDTFSYQASSEEKPPGARGSAAGAAKVAAAAPAAAGAARVSKRRQAQDQGRRVKQAAATAAATAATSPTKQSTTALAGGEAPNGKLLDLPPSLKENLAVVFVGFNPGVQSSLTQHHYAHFTNLFWKLFNQSKLIFSVLDTDTVQHDGYIQERVTIGVDSQPQSSESRFKAEDDNELVNYGIGFTDLVLRCTKAISELSTQEKLDNVPRLLDDLRFAKPKFIAIIGKGIWECVVQHLNDNKKFKLSEFHWGKQEGGDGRYKVILRKLQKLLDYQYEIYVFPNTSGLVTALKFPEKLALWNQLVYSIYKEKAGASIEGTAG